jgi:uncharacterized protein YkwD
MPHNNIRTALRTCNFSRWIGAALALGLLSGCNLGSEDESIPIGTGATLTTSAALPAVQATVYATPTATAIAAATTPTSSSSQTAATTCSITAFQSAVVAEVNRRRATAQTCGSRGTYAAAAALRWHDTLFRAAAGHGLDMVTHNFFSHTGRDGSMVGARLTAAGYAWASAAENIAAGQPTVTRVVDAWMGSDGHCANLMNPAMEEFAVACVYNTGNRSNYWTMALGKPR